MTAKLPLEKSHATAIIERGQWRAIQYHQTEVIGWNEEIVRLDTGGWLTSASTIRRINQGSERFNLGVHVFKHKGEVYAQFPGEEPIPFYDGLTLSRDRSKPLASERTIPDGRDYNGWPNRATWNCMLWLNNTEGYYRSYIAQARRAEFTETSARDFVIRLLGFRSAWDAVTPDGEPLHKVHWGRIASAMNEVREEDARQAAAERRRRFDALGITMQARQVARRSDGLHTDFDAGARHWEITLTRNGESAEFQYSVGSLADGAVTLPDVLNCLITDWETGIGSFEDMIGDFGLEDSEATRYTFQQCQRNAQEMARLFPDMEPYDLGEIVAEFVSL